MRRVLSVVPAVVLLACASASEAPVATRADKVINGVVDNPPKYDATILIQTELSGGYGAGCTATLITPHVAITARHCVSSYDDGTRRFGADYTPSKMHIWYGPEPRGTPDNGVVRIVHDGASQIADSDFAIIVLKDAVTRVPFAPIRLEKPPVKGETVAVAGYGVTNFDMPSSSFSLHKRYRRENLKIAYVGPIPSYYIGAREIVMGESICQGDSGGPVYAQGTGALLAVTSRGGNGRESTATQPWLGCTGSDTMNIFARVDGFAALIKKTVSEVGEIIWEEGTEKPEQPTTKLPDPGQLGAVCAAPGECASKLCVSFDGKNVCSQTCDEANPCPEGFMCAGGYCVAGTEGPVGPTTELPPEEPAAQTTTTTTTTGCATSAPGSTSSLAALGLVAAVGLLSRRRR